MPYYINPLNGTLAWDAVLPPGAIETSDPNGIGAQHLAPADSWYALPGNGGRVYIKAGNPIPTSGNNQWATPYQAIDDQGTMPPDPNGGVIHQPGASSAANWALPGRGQFENQAWTGPSDWRGVPFAQMDTQGRPLSSYNNLVDQLQQSRQPIPIGQQFGRWAFGGGLLNQPQGSPQTAQGGLLGQPTTPPPPAPPRVATDASSAGGFFAQPQTTTQTPYQPNFNPTPAAPTPAPAAPATQPGPFSGQPTTGLGGLPIYGYGPNDVFQGMTDPAYSWFKPGDLGYATRDEMYAARAPWLAAREQANLLAQYGYNAANPYTTVENDPGKGY